MPDFVIRHIDSLLAERILALAKERQWPINDVVLGALRRGLDMSLPGADMTCATFDAAAAVDHRWDALETAAFQEAMQALSMAQPAPLAPAQDGWPSSSPR